MITSSKKKKKKEEKKMTLFSMKLCGRRPFQVDIVLYENVWNGKR